MRRPAVPTRRRWCSISHRWATRIRPRPTQPLAAADRDSLAGKYVYGPGPRDYFTVDVQQDRLGIDRPGSPARRFLMHTGNLIFFPSGVPTAKIAFAREGSRVTTLTIADPNVADASGLNDQLRVRTVPVRTVPR